MENRGSGSPARRKSFRIFMRLRNRDLAYCDGAFCERGSCEGEFCGGEFREGAFCEGSLEPVFSCLRSVTRPSPS